MNENFFNWSGEIMYASIYPTICRRCFLFLVTLFHGDIILLYLHAYLEYDFMMANLVTLNLAVLKILKTSQEYTSSGMAC